MAFGPPEKFANDGAPITGVKLTPSQKFNYCLPGHDYSRYQVTVLSCYPGGLMSRLDPSALPLPGETAPRGGVRASAATTKAQAKAKRDEQSKVKKKAREEGTIVDPSVLPGDPDEILASPTDARNSRALEAGRKAAYLSPDDPTMLVCPPENLIGMFVEAGKCWPRTGLTRACGAAVMVEACDDSDVIPFLNPETDKPLRFNKDTRVVEHPVSSRNPPPASTLVLLYKAKSSNNKRILTARTYMPSWKLHFRLGFDTSIFDSKDAIEMFRLNVLAYAGGYIGLGSWRPGAPKGPGPFGRFQLVSFDPIQ